LTAEIGLQLATAANYKIILDFDGLFDEWYRSYSITVSTSSVILEEIAVLKDQC
jgi:hypothetical protein